MPAYDFECAHCGGFSVLKPIAKRNDVQVCPGCGKTAERQLIAAPALALMSPTVRTAAVVNEKSRHEPQHSSAHHCGAQCAHKTSAPSLVSKSFPQKRPWMISH